MKLAGLAVGNRFVTSGGKTLIVTGFARDSRGCLVDFDEVSPTGLRTTGARASWASFERLVQRKAS